MTLVEVMVAITLSLILLSGVMQIFLSSKHTYLMNEELSRLQENGRLVLDLLAHDVRMIGYQGCADPEDIPASIYANSPPTIDLVDTALGGSEIGSSVWDPAGPSQLPTTVTDENGNSFTLANLPSANTDLIITQFANPVDAQSTTSATDVTADISLTQNPGGFATDDVLVISDCDSVDMFRASEVVEDSGTFTISHASTHNSQAAFSKQYAAGSRVFHFESNVYFIAPARNADGSAKTNSRGSAINALYRADVDGNLISLVEGVDNMQILYGERLSAGNVHYLRADNTDLDMNKVDSVKIGLLMSTIEGVTDADDTNVYTVAGTDISPAGTTGAAVTYPLDRRVRRVYTATINLRNRQ